MLYASQVCNVVFVIAVFKDTNSQLLHIICINHSLICPHLESTECQDGVTNNCSQTCTRDDLKEHQCSCFVGYELIDGLCTGEYVDLCLYTSIIVILQCIVDVLLLIKDL